MGGYGPRRASLSGSRKETAWRPTMSSTVVKRVIKMSE